MPNNETTTKFKVDISELKSAMQEAKRQVAVANSEFKAASSSLDDWSKSSDGLSAKLKQLDTTLKAQETMLDSLEKQYELTVKQMGEGSKEADSLKISINNQKAAINNTKKDMAKFSTELDKVAEAEKIAAESGKSVDDVLKDMAEASKDAGDAAKKSADGFTVMKGALANLVAKGITAALNGVKKLSSSLVDLGLKADDLNTLAAQSGFTTEMLQKFEYAADTIDVSMDDIVKSAQKLKKNMVSNSKDTAAAFEQLGVNVNDSNGELRDSTTVYWEVIKALSQVENETERDTLAMQLLGKGADSLAGIIDDGGEALNRLGKEAEDVGVILSQDTLDAANDFNDSVDKIKATAKGTFSKIGAEVAKKLVPELEDLAKEAQKAAKNIDWTKVVKNVVGTLKKFISLIKNAAQKVLPVLNKVLGFVVDNFDGLVKITLTAVTVFKTFKAVMAIRSTINAVKTATSALTAGVGLATKAQTVWNAALSANPIGAVVTAVALLTAGIIALVKSTDDVTYAYSDAKQKALDLAAAFEETKTKAAEQAEAFRDSKTAADELAAAENANIDYTNKLWNELKTLVDENGKVKEGYEGRAEFILGQLNDALGTEYDLNNGIIEQYGEMKESIDKLIETKKAQILLDAYQETYKEAVENVATAEKARAEQAQELAAQQVVYDEARTKALLKQQELEEKLASGELKTGSRQYDLLKGNVAGLEAVADRELRILEQQQEAYKTTNAEVESYYNMIDTYESASAAAIEGKASDAIASLSTLSSGFQTAASTAKLSADEQKKVLEQQVIDTEVNLGILEADYKKSAADMTEAQKKEAENRINNAKIEAENAKKEYIKVGGNLIKGVADGVNGSAYELNDAMKKAVNDALEAAKKTAEIKSPSKVFKREVGRYIGLGVAAGVDDTTADIAKSVKNQINGIRSAYSGAVNGLSGGVSSVKASGGVTNNYYQTINSPKELSRLEIYRQSKNLLGFAGGGT